MKVNKELESMTELRKRCYTCMRPESSCMCVHVDPIDTRTLFVILMHPMEHRKEKNGTGHLTHLQLKDSKLIVGVDFTQNKQVNEILNNEDLINFILYPGNKSINLSADDQSLKLNGKTACIFIIDGTWPCAKKMLKLSKNLHDLPRLSFENSEKSKFSIKQQPSPLCLSTIESTLKLIELLKLHRIEKCDTSEFLKPFEKMIEYQVECIRDPNKKSYRGTKVRVPGIKTDGRYKKETARSLFFIKDDL